MKNSIFFMVKSVLDESIIHCYRTRKNLEVFCIALMKPNLNEQCDSNVLTLCRNGIT